MNSQTLLVIAIVGAALLFVGRRAWKQLQAARTKKAGCGDGCGCGH
jgi:hypothetical protein